MTDPLMLLPGVDIVELKIEPYEYDELPEGWKAYVLDIEVNGETKKFIKVYWTETRWIGIEVGEVSFNIDTNIDEMIVEVQTNLLPYLNGPTTETVQ